MRTLTHTLLVASAFGLAASASAWTNLTSGHYDLGVAYEGGELEPHIHGHGGGGEEFDPTEVGFWAKDQHLTTRPNSSSFDFIGVGAGESYYRLRQNNVSGQIYLGFGAEEIEGGVVDAYTISDPRADLVYGTDTGEWIEWRLKSVYSSTGGDFSVWQGSGDPDPLWIASSDGIDASDMFLQQTGGHEHTNFGFSQAGLYGITFTVATQIGGQSVTKDVTYTFGVGDDYEPDQAVPEPASMAALGLGALALLRRRKRA